MAKLLQNERTKLYKKPSTWVLSGVVILLMLSTVVLLKVINIISAGCLEGCLSKQPAEQ